MRKLKKHEFLGLQYVDQQGSVCVGVADDEFKAAAAMTFSGLHKLNLLLAEQTDDGPRYSLSPLGRQKLGLIEDAIDE